MTDIRKITPEEVAAAVAELNHQLKTAGGGTLGRIDCSPENLEQGLARLVLSLIELLRRLLERQAVLRMEGGSLDDAKVDACLADQAALDALNARNQRHATTDKVDSTPTFDIGGKRIEGYATLAQLDAAIAAARHRA